MFSALVLPVIERFCQGFNATVLAYGQTGSGKTFTMGTSTDAKEFLAKEPSGVVPHTLMVLFAYMKVASQTYDVTLKVSRPGRLSDFRQAFKLIFSFCRSSTLRYTMKTWQTCFLRNRQILLRKSQQRSPSWTSARSRTARCTWRVRARCRSRAGRRWRGSSTRATQRGARRHTSAIIT